MRKVEQIIILRVKLNKISCLINTDQSLEEKIESRLSKQTTKEDNKQFQSIQLSTRSQLQQNSQDNQINYYQIELVMELLMQQNKRLREIMQKCEKEIMQLRRVGQEHQEQIGNLLKFNQRLLSIIQNQVPNKAISRIQSGSNLQPIEQAGEKEQINYGVSNITQNRFISQNNQIQQRVDHLPEQDICEQNYHREQQLRQQQQQQQQQQEQTEQQQQQQQHPQLFKNNNYHQKEQGQMTNQQLYKNNIISKQEKELHIDIPKGLNQHYQKQLFQSIEDNSTTNYNNNNMSNNDNSTNTANRHLLNINNLNDNKLNINNLNENSYGMKLSIQSQVIDNVSQAASQMVKMNEQQLRQQLESIRVLLNQYKEDFNTQQYSHLCQIIKHDLQNDLTQITLINNDQNKLYVSKQKECQRLKQEIVQFNPINSIIEIMKSLNVSEETESMVIHRVTGTNINSSSSNVSIMVKQQ